MPTGDAYSSGHLVPSLWDLHMFYLLRPILFRTCRYFTGLCSSNIPRYFLDFACFNFCRSYVPFRTLNTRIHSFPHFSLTCIEILSWNFAYDFVLLYYRWRVSSICVNFCGSYAPFELRILDIHSFPHFSLHCLDILSWNFAYDFVLLYYRPKVSSICVNFCGSYAPFGT